MTSQEELKALMHCRQMAMALDLHYKKLTCLSREKFKTIWTVLLNAFKAFCNKRQQEGGPTALEENSMDGTTEQVAKKQKLTLLLSKSESHSSNDKADARNGALADLTRYREGLIPETENPLVWWKLNSHRFSVLASFVKIILYVPATTVQCKRLFSSSKYIVNKM